MTTDYHTEFGIGEDVDIVAVNQRLAELDEAIGDKSGGTISVAVLRHVESTTVDGGGASAATWNVRTLNDETDPDGIVSLSSNKFTPSAGDYSIDVASCASQVDAHKVRVYNVTQTSVVAVGLNMDAGTGGIGQIAPLSATFTANGTDEYRIDHYTETARASDGLGEAVGDGDDEVYCEVVLTLLD